ncbi:MAG: hypothetical protein ABTQ26_14330 [Azonexus sp.]
MFHHDSLNENDEAIISEESADDPLQPCRFNYPPAGNRMEQAHVLRLKGSTSVIQALRTWQIAIAITRRSDSPAAMESSGIVARYSAMLCGRIEPI